MSDQACFNRNGNQDTAMIPCSTVDDNLTHCCVSDYHCASNGLCVRKSGVDSDYAYNIGGCTVEEWNSDGCVEHCKDIGYFVQACNNYNGDGAGFSCVNGSTRDYDCNTSRDMFFSLDNIRIPPTPSTSSATSSQTDTSPSATGSGDGSDSSDDSGGNALAIGLGVGLGVGAIAIIGLVAWFIIRRRRNRHDENYPPAGVGFESYQVKAVSQNNSNPGQWQQQTDTPKPYQDHASTHASTPSNNGAGVYYEPARSPPVYEAPGDSVAIELPGAGEHR